MKKYGSTMFLIVNDWNPCLGRRGKKTILRQMGYSTMKSKEIPARSLFDISYHGYQMLSCLYSQFRLILWCSDMGLITFTGTIPIGIKLRHMNMQSLWQRKLTSQLLKRSPLSETNSRQADSTRNIILSHYHSLSSVMYCSITGR